MEKTREQIKNVKPVTGPSRAALGVKEKAKVKKVSFWDRVLGKGRKAEAARKNKWKKLENAKTRKVIEATGGAIKSDVEKYKDRMKGK